MKKTILLYATVSVLLWGSFLSAQVDYRIGPQDVLEIRVQGLQEYPVQERVSELGKITLPLLREVDVAGLTKSQLEQKLTGLLEERFLQNPQVSVFIVQFQSKLVYVTGAVVNQGPQELRGSQRLMQIISRAGGLTPDAGKEIIVIRSLNDGRNKTIKIPIEELFVNGDADLDIPLRADDRIMVLIDKVVHVYVMGEVNTPGRLDVKLSDLESFTLLKAIAQAGGFSERASKGKVKVKRISDDGTEEEIKINVKDILNGKIKDFPLMENDVVFVPETIF
jgi:polysaccharide export outer membrane protein